MTNKKIKVSVVITTRNRYGDLLLCLESLKEDLERDDRELLIVDDASFDKTVSITEKFLAKYSKNARIIHQPRQLMMVRTRNMGARAALGELILFIDDDNIIERGMVDFLCEAADKYPNFGVFGPQMCYADKKPYLFCQKFNLFNGITTRKAPLTSKENEGKPFLNFLDKFLVSGFSKNGKRLDIYETDGVPNVFMIRKKVFEECGFFDEKLIQTFTEMDFSLHIKRYGYKSGIVPKAKTYHQIDQKDDFTPRGLGGKFEQKAYCLMRNRTVMVSRYGGLINKTVYLLFFSWFWPLIYSSIALKFGSFHLVKIYVYGFRDGILYLLTGKLTNSLKKIL